MKAECSSTAHVCTILLLPGLVGTVRWAVTWMRANYAHDLMMCCLFIIYGAIYAGGLPLMMEYLFDTALPNMQKGYPLAYLDIHVASSPLLQLTPPSSN